MHLYTLKFKSETKYISNKNMFFFIKILGVFDTEEISFLKIKKKIIFLFTCYTYDRVWFDIEHDII